MQVHTEIHNPNTSSPKTLKELEEYINKRLDEFGTEHIVGEVRTKLLEKKVKDFTSTYVNWANKTLESWGMKEKLTGKINYYCDQVTIDFHPINPKKFELEKQELGL
jgi:hypothetical protein